MAGRRTALNHRIVVRLGELSFAFYLLHNLVLKHGRLAMGGVEKDGDLVGPNYGMSAGLALIVAAFLLSLLLAWVLNVLVERPAMRRWSGPRPAPGPAPTPVGGRCDRPSGQCAVRARPKDLSNGRCLIVGHLRGTAPVLRRA
ncbi:hypothetical protein ACWC9T_11510 [Kitasatospora sp. NPDC001159]